ncbi:MAG TPA: YhdP family protein [Casimicrobiaceae bacterium]|nr:YhdP family protein [Casimicrobiaceae bacterium]
MPVASASPSPIAALRSGLLALWRVARVVFLGAVIAFCVSLLLLRYVGLPWIESNRDQLARLLSSKIGHPVEISTLTTGWDGWNPTLDLRGFRLIDPDNGAELISLPAVRLVIAWTSLLFVDLRMKELAIEGPQLIVRRDADGVLHVAGATFDPALRTSDRPLAQWVLRQPRILIHDATIVWRDELANSSELVVERVELRLEDRFGHHRFGLKGIPPPQLAAPVDFRGDVSDLSLGDWHMMKARFYARVDYADIAAWREWLPMDIPMRSGKGALRVWSDFEGGRAREIVADVVLADVQTRLASDLPELELSGLQGRLGWSDDGKRREFYTQHLTFAGPSGASFAPTDFRLTMLSGAGGTNAGKIEFTRLELTPLRQMAAFLPLPAKWREDLARVAPRGTLERGTLEWRGEPQAPQAISGSGRFVDLGYSSQGDVPGLSGLTGSFDATPQGGTLKLDSKALNFEYPRIFAERLAFDTMQGQVRWHRDHDSMVFEFDQVAFANQDLAGTAKGEYVAEAQGPGKIDMTAQLSRGGAQQVYRYVPIIINADVREWLRRALVAGTTSDTRLKLSGKLTDFPFVDGKTGQFQVLIKAQGATLDYLERWPAITGIDAEVRFEGARMVVDAKHGKVAGFDLAHCKADIADMRLPHPVLHIDGEGSGSTAEALRFINETPVADWIDHASDGASAIGSGKLTLKLGLPLGKPENNTVAGEYTFDNNRMVVVGGAPAVSQLNGKLAFTERSVDSSGLTGDILGGPARFSVATGEGRVRVEGQGSLNLGLLRTEFPQHMLLARLSGITDWRLGANILHTGSNLELESSLKGAVIDLPMPARKAAQDVVAFKIERRLTAPGRDMIAASYGRLGRLVIDRKLTESGAVAERALLSLGSTSGEPERRGLWVRGEVDAVDFDGWLLVKDQLGSGDAEELPLSGVEASVRALDVFGRSFNDLHIGASRAGNDWQFDLRGREVQGSGRWQASAPGRLGGRLTARLQRFMTPGPAAIASAAPPSKADGATSPWPAIDIVADSFTAKGHELGKLQLLAQPTDTDWRIERVTLTNDEGTLEASGWWHSGRRSQQTELDAKLDVRDAGGYLALFGLPDAVRGAPTKLQGQVSWAGSPQDFDYPSLNGSFRIDTGPGQFIKLDPGVGKLLGVLSLQSLKRRLAFDYKDVFGEGFAFDELTGDVKIQDGVMKSSNLQIIGPAARIFISGEADIAHETQNLQVHVQPTLSSGVSLGAAALMFANPIVGAAIGAGSLLAQKAFSDPIEKMFASDYVVSGGWSDPQVERPKSRVPTAERVDGLPR